MYRAMRAFVASSLVTITVREYRNWGSWGMLDHTLLLVYNTTKIQLIVELWTHVCGTREAFPVASCPEAHLNISLFRATPMFLLVMYDEIHNRIFLEHVPDHIANSPGRNFPIFLCLSI